MNLSIIIPIYNAEKYLNRCVDSILSQRLRDYEVILVDNNSSDNSPEIAENYAKKIDYVKVLTVEKQGVSAARNAAIDIAVGKYIMFVDSDDFWIEDSVAQLLEKCKDTELVISGFDISYNENVMEVKEQKDEMISVDTFLKRVITPANQYYYGVLWNKVFSASIIGKYKIRFREDIDLCEDWPFILNYIQHISKIKIVGGHFYSYTQDNAFSLVKKSRGRSENWRIMYSVYNYICEVYERYSLYEEMKRDISSFILNPIIKEAIEMVKEGCNVCQLKKFLQMDTIQEAITFCVPRDVFERRMVWLLRARKYWLMWLYLHCDIFFSAAYRVNKTYYKVKELK